MQLFPTRLEALLGQSPFTVGVVSGGHFFSHFYLLTMPPLFPLLVEDFAVDNAELGLTVSMMYLSLFLFQIPAGELVDKVGAKRMFVAGLLLTAGGTMLIGVANSYVSLLAFAFVAGVGQSAFHPADYALLNAVTDADQEGKTFSVHTFAGFVGFAAAPPIVGGIGLVYGWQVALFAVGAVGLVYGAVSQLTMDPVYKAHLDRDDAADTDADSSRFESVRLLAQPHILALFTFFVAVTMADIGIQSFTAVFFVDALGFTEAIGNAALTAFPAFTAVGVLVGGVLSDRYDSYWLIVVSLLGAAVATWVGASGVVGFSSTAAIAVWAVIGFAFGLALPARDRVVNDVSSTGTTGKSFGIVYTGLPIGGLVAPVLLGSVMDLADSNTAFMLSGWFFLAGSVIVFALAKNVRSAGVPRPWRSD